MSSIQVRSAHLDQLVVGTLDAKLSARGDRILRYYIDFRHRALNLHKEVSAPELFILQSKVDTLMASWDQKYVDLLAKRTLRAGAESAAELEAEERLKRERFSSFLSFTLKIDDRIKWESLKDFTLFKKDSFRDPKPQIAYPVEPDFIEPRISFFQRLIGKSSSIRDDANSEFEGLMEEWRQLKTELESDYSREMNLWNQKKAAFAAEQERLECEFLEGQRQENDAIDDLYEKVEAGDEAAVLEQLTMVLDSSNYHELFEKSFVLDYQADDKTVILEYQLPNIKQVPNIKTVRFVKSTGEIKETYISDRELKALYDSACYQIALPVYPLDACMRIGYIMGYDEKPIRFS